ncbi:glycosyltransferase [Neoroseomonas soli]|uniref:Glycosyltransferase n=1 Tax=Neoroseomonas soli TaxID=1081025 RepID=A0A9X9X4G0_9PROT|nr:glycosyltransferase [Neoroseomonas soli]MBR0674289.1 glycosyltransferase [Neoroseomonas soli]
MPNRRIAVVTPVLNDWASLEHLLAALGGVAPTIGEVSVLVVDDGSTEAAATDKLARLAAGLTGLEIIRLACNLGHQRAIAVGLAELARRDGLDIVVVMDADGEDRPEDIAALLREHEAHPEAIVVAMRAERSEDRTFKALYHVYKAVFRASTGVTIDFGNFCLIPAPLLTRLVARPEIWNHLAATVIRSRTPLRRLPTARGTRYAGRSTMNLVSLVTHGLSGISVFVSEVFVRFLGLSLVMVAACVGVIGTVSAIRIFTDLAIPGWATTVVGISLVMLLQLFTMTTALAFVMLSNRMAAPIMPALHAAYYIRSIDVVA